MRIFGQNTLILFYLCSIMFFNTYYSKANVKFKGKSVRLWQKKQTLTLFITP